MQDNPVIRATVDRATLVADEVTIGHGALLEGCSIESGAVIGMGAIVPEDATVGPNAMIAAGSVVTSGTVIRPRMLAAGVSAKVKKEILRRYKPVPQSIPDSPENISPSFWIDNTFCVTEYLLCDKFEATNY